MQRQLWHVLRAFQMQLQASGSGVHARLLLLQSWLYCRLYSLLLGAYA